MGLFSDKCPNCGNSVSKRAKFWLFCKIGHRDSCRLTVDAA